MLLPIHAIHALPGAPAYFPRAPFGPLVAAGGLTMLPWREAERWTAGSIFDDIGHAASSVARGIGDVAQGAIDILHQVPGVDAIGNALKALGHTLEDFARTDVGHFVLQAFSTGLYYGLAPFLGPQLASVAFVVPGMARGEPVDKAYLAELMSRVKQTADILSAGQGGEAVKGVVKQLGDQVAGVAGPLVDQLTSLGAYVKDQAGAIVPSASFGPIVDKLNPQDLARRFGIREDMAQLAIDAVRRAGTSFAAGPGLPGKVFDPKTGRQMIFQVPRPPAEAYAMFAALPDPIRTQLASATWQTALKKFAALPPGVREAAAIADVRAHAPQPKGPVMLHPINAAALHALQVRLRARASWVAHYTARRGFPR